MKVSKEAEERIRREVEYPADKQAVLGKLAEAPDLTETEKTWLSRLPEKSYTSADEVIAALGRVSSQKGTPQEMPGGSPSAA